MLAVAAGLFLVGCTQQEPGDPRPGGTTTGESTSDSSSTPTTSRSSRPKEIKLDGVDPCKVLTADQMKQLSVVKAQADEGNLSGIGKYPLCDYHTRSAPVFGYGVGLVTNGGIEHWQGNGNVDVNRTEVSGYPAAQLVLSGTDNVMCSIAVDVADGQQLVVDFNPLGDEFTQDEMCQNAKKAAELALVTLPTLV
ncbi:DUF3558 domain-containing protein [Saccharothrix hoggarensis]|uniref:DUF3558 domain-containing protein n=1 Tax=Saccharothrix hoggarensis TaxID=913853 RepID=A0ABW3QLH2_9PSEU